MKPSVKWASGIAAATGVIMIAAGAWWLWPATPVDAPYFRWDASAGDRYELVVDHAAGNPDFRNGVATPRVPQSGVLRVRGGPGAAEPGAIVEVSNRRTRQASATTAGADGAFAVEVQVRRGDELLVLSRKITFRPLAPPRPQPVAGQ
jgi:hypothetical protein